jgi:hypothetical protein
MKKPLQIWFLFQATLPLFRLFVDHVQMNQLFTNSDYLDIQLIRVRDNKIRLYLFFTIGTEVMWLEIKTKFVVAFWVIYTA